MTKDKLQTNQLCYVALQDINFTNGERHIKGRTYFPTVGTEAYFEVCGIGYTKHEVKTIVISGRTIPAPNHEVGYTKTYLIGWMESTGANSVGDFRRWAERNVWGVSEHGESVFSYQDVVLYFTQASV